MLLLALSSCGGGGGGGSSAANLVSIMVSPSNLSLIKGTSGQFSATGHYSDGSTKDITSAVTWNSTDPGIATISASGTVMALAAGQTKITASSGSIISDGAVLTVVEVTSLEIQPSNPSLGLGAAQPFTVTAHLSDGTTRDVTETALWSSSAPSVAGVSNQQGSRGWVTAFETGTAIITAGWNGFSDSTSISVTPMDNVAKITVNGSLCSSYRYPNKPCVRVTLCVPGTTACKTVDDILLDTGSTGLRIFRSVISDLTLPPVTTSTGQLANCTQYLDETAQWGPVQRADVIVGGKKVSNIPIVVIDAAFGTVPSSCGSPQQSPAEAEMNGILGVSHFTEDCGDLCVSALNNKYFSCDGSTCSATTVPLSDQLKNPVALMDGDNNGFVIRLPAVDLGGVSSVDGVLVLGIGTQSNNTPFGVKATIALNADGEFTTVFRNRSYPESFMDTGSNGLFFNRSGLSSLIICGDWYCPASLQNLSASLAANTVDFQIGNATDLLNSSGNVFRELGGSYAAFDWGLPFFLGRNVFVGLEGKSSALGTGPYIAY